MEYADKCVKTPLKIGDRTNEKRKKIRIWNRHEKKFNEKKNDHKNINRLKMLVVCLTVNGLETAK